MSEKRRSIAKSPTLISPSWVNLEAAAVFSKTEDLANVQRVKYPDVQLIWCFVGKQQSPTNLDNYGFTASDIVLFSTFKVVANDIAVA